MKVIALLAVMAMLLAACLGPHASVGGPMTLMLVLLLVMLAVGIQEARSRERGAIGWIVNVVASIIGGLVAVGVAGMSMETILTQFHFEGSLASSQHPLLYVAAAGMAIFTVLGSWLTLGIVNRFR